MSDYSDRLYIECGTRLMEIDKLEKALALEEQAREKAEAALITEKRMYELETAVTESLGKKFEAERTAHEATKRVLELVESQRDTLMDLKNRYFAERNEALGRAEKLEKKIAYESGLVRELYGTLEDFKGRLHDEQKERAKAEDRPGCWCTETFDCGCQPYF